MVSNLIKAKGLAVLFIHLMLFSGCQARQAPPAKDEAGRMGWSESCVKVEEMSISVSEADMAMINELVSSISKEAGKVAEIGDLILSLGEKLLGTPYVAHTLEVNATEQLVVNLQEVDCTTFVEYILALALTIEEGKAGFEDYASILACLRYREGYPNGYASRLHYFSEWLHLHAQQGLLELVSEPIGSKPFDSKVSFMTAHPGAYPQMADPAILEQMKEVEKNVSALKTNFIPKEDIREVEKYIQNGDIIAFTTDIEGLDVSHTGFAYFREGRLHLLHASTRGNSVEVSVVPLSEYLAEMRRVIGILVARVK
ncbi:MAG: N-acetylmuramoyl-L-alanine amidase-like domain-containing protein [Bacteroides sp.]|jgi:hypothetical protein|nr:N-acetylmuramoyl-L-alanine amidase-like domain-containing protein [Bacteroides sp.]